MSDVYAAVPLLSDNDGSSSGGDGGFLNTVGETSRRAVMNEEGQIRTPILVSVVAISVVGLFFLFKMLWEQ